MTEDQKRTAEALELLVAKYNNALQCIVLTADLAMLDLDKDSPAYKSFNEIKQSAMETAPQQETIGGHSGHF